MPRTSSRSSERTWPSMSPSQPFEIPTTSMPCVPVARLTTARTTAFSPGQSPPAVRTPRTTANSIQEHRLAGHVTHLRLVLLDVVQLVDVHAPHALPGGADGHSRVRPASERDHTAGRSLEREIRGHDRVVRRHHQVERVRDARAHQVPELLVDDVLAGALL